MSNTKHRPPSLSLRGLGLALLAAVALIFFNLSCQEQGTIKKSNLKILYVWGSSDYDRSSGRDSVLVAKGAEERRDAFEKMLHEYFDSVTLVRALDYAQDMSKDYDVTVIDGTPTPIVPRKIERDESGRVLSIQQAIYFTEDFDYPIVTIGELGETLGRGIGLKTDWYCLCLDAEALNWRKKHPIFKGPFPVKLTVVTKPTPEDAFSYAYFHDGVVPDSIPMWAVQTKGYKTEQGFRVGMVSRPWRFEDSPDAEYISSGVNAKTLDAVAIGRHGNFLHWGFAASPTYMTEEGQRVLANAIVYISKFKGKGVIARKYNDRIATREWLKELKYYATYESYEKTVKRNEEFANSMLERQKNAQEKKERGETLTRDEQSALNYRRPPAISFEDHIKRQQRNFFPLIGMNVEEYAKFYDANYDYFYGEGFYNLEVDEDVKSLGIPNYNHRILNEAIKMLESGKDVEKGKRILARYTLRNFSTAKEWRHWYDRNKKKLFFTEPGGWLFLVNTYESGENNYHAEDEQQAVSAIQPVETDDMNPVSIAAGLINKKNGNQEVVVKVKIHPGYHIYANVSPSDPFIKTEVKIDLPNGYKTVGEMKMPAFSAYNQSSATTIYEDEVVFTQEIVGIGKGDINCSVTYQCCDGQICFPPENKTQVVKL